MQSALFIYHNSKVLYHRVEAQQTVIKDDRHAGNLTLSGHAQVLWVNFRHRAGSFGLSALRALRLLRVFKVTK